MNIGFRALNLRTDWPWCNDQIGLVRVEDTSGIIAFDQDTNKQLAAVLFDNWTGNSVQAHMIITNPLVIKHGFLTLAYDFAFKHKKLKYIYGLVPADNVKAVKFNKHMGWTIKTRLPEAYADGVDYLVMQVTPEDWATADLKSSPF